MLKKFISVPFYGVSRSSKPIPLAIPNALDEQITEVAKKMDMSKQDLMRLAMRVGLDDLKAINYNVAGAIVAEKEGKHKTRPPRSSNSGGETEK